MIVQFIQKEWNDFYIAALSKDRSNEIEINQWISSNNTTTQKRLTIGKTFGRIIAIATYNNCLWIYKFFIPIAIVHIIISSLFSFLLDDKGYSFTVLDDTPYIHSNRGEIITNDRGVTISTRTTLSNVKYYIGMVSHLYLIVVTTSTMIYGIATIFTNKISTNMYKDNTAQPPSYIKCIIQTIQYSSLNILIIVLLLFIPTCIVIQIIHNTEYNVDDYLFYYLGTMYSPYSAFHSIIYYTIVVLELVFVLLFVYYSILCLLLVIPCIIFEKIYNPFSALYRSYQLTKNQSIIIVILSLVSLFTLGLIESLFISLRYDTLYNYYEDHYYTTDTSNRNIYKWILCKLLISVPDIFFIPYIAIFQTVIYCNVCTINEIVYDKQSSSSTTGSMLSH